jgi:N-acetylglucosaminyldiphosphoundecaprenol N-acetyl-beta-D-mannosaminyltransferase
MDVRERVSLMGMQIDRVTEGQAVATIGRSLEAGRGGWVITPNLEHLRQFSKQHSLRSLFENADHVLADGMPLVWASRLAGTPLPARVAGSDLIWSLSSEAGRRGASIFVLGGTREAGWEAARRLKEKCPGLRIAGMIYPPLGFEHDPQAMEQIEDTLAEVRPDIVYVGLGFPKQERVIARLRQRFPRTWFLGIGISIGFVGGHVSRAPVWMQRIGLEWLHRLAQEPRRLARRYLVHGLPFAARLLAHGAAVRFSGTRLRTGARLTQGRVRQAPAQIGPAAAAAPAPGASAATPASRPRSTAGRLGRRTTTARS